MCPPEGIRCPPSHKSICSYYCIFREDSGFFSFSGVSIVSCCTGGYLSVFAEYSGLFLKTSGRAINNDITSFVMNLDPKEHVF